MSPGRLKESPVHLDRLPADKGAKIVLYCRTGPMGTRAARDLVGLGYTSRREGPRLLLGFVCEDCGHERLILRRSFLTGT